MVKWMIVTVTGRKKNRINTIVFFAVSQAPEKKIKKNIRHGITIT
jgi:hypothetical protein